MKSGRQAVGLGAIVVFSVSFMAAGSALAFGQQWRPAPGFAMAQPYQRVAAGQAFRPRGSVPAGYQRFDRIQQRPQRSAPWPTYLPHMGDPRMGGAFYPPPQFARTNPAYAGWPRPMDHAGQFWPQQAPPFTRQFGWQPSGNPWIARMPTAMPQQPRYRYPVNPQTAGFRPAGPGYEPPRGGWRPMQPPGPSMPLNYVYQSGVYNAGREPVPGAARMPGVHSLPVAAARPYWRPELRNQATAWQSGSTFRPLAYGRGTAADVKVATRSEDGRAFTRDNLPGWVTTYQEAADRDSCSWCGGS